MLAAAHFLGESIKAHRYEPRLQSGAMIIGAGEPGRRAVPGAERGRASARSYLTANGVTALSLPFIGIQLGLFAVAVAASTWVAHPYRAEWRQAGREVRTRPPSTSRRGGRQPGWRPRQRARPQHRGLVAQGWTVWRPSCPTEPGRGTCTCVATSTVCRSR